MRNLVRNLLLVVLVALSSCTMTETNIHAVTADSISDAANTALGILQQKYREEGFRELEHVLATGGTREDAYAARAKVIARWSNIWRAWETMRIAHEVWVNAIESGGDLGVALEGMKRAYCGLREVWPEDIPAIPLAPMSCTESERFTS